MALSLADQVAAMRRQLGRLRRVALVSAGAGLAGTVLLLPTLPAPWMLAAMAVLVMLFLVRKLHQERWARRAIKQLRLEEQFIQHGPLPEEVLTCVRRRHHLWTQSLTLRSLENLLAAPPSALLRPSVREAKAGAAFRKGFKAIRPARLPLDVLLFMMLTAFWLFAVPEALLATPSAGVLLGVLAWVPALAAEIILLVLLSDLRGGFATLTHHLGAWTLARQFDALVEAAQEHTYRHTRVYHARHLVRSPASLS